MPQNFNSLTILWLLHTYTDTISWNVSFSFDRYCNLLGRKKFKASSKLLFPYDQPELHLPWVWDVVADPVHRYVEFIAVSRSACFFDQDAWHRALELFPQYRKQLGDGAEENILVTTNTDRVFDFVGVRNKHQGILGKTLTCVYYDEDGNILSSLRSLPVRGDPFFSSIGTISVRCPYPTEYVSHWHHVSLRRPPLDEPALSSLRHRLKQPLVLATNETEQFQICNLPPYNSQPKLKRFRLTVCTANMEESRENLVEWIEFHLLIGVQHFFIYDTAQQVSSATSLTQLLGDYIQDGLVTVVAWSFSNCVRNMASGDWILWFEKGQKQLKGLQPPRAIAQSAALASCYSRFRSTSRYMLHIDVDEFLSVIPRNRRSITAELPGPVDLAKMADKYFLRHPTIPALSFAPIHMHRCVQGPVELAHQLPRVHTWNHGNLSDRSIHNGKLLMRTEAVGGFFVHYITMLEDYPRNESHPNRRWNRLPYRVPIKFAALLHYKVPAHVSGSIYGQLLPLRNTENASCRTAARLRSYREHRARGGPELKLLSDYAFEHLALSEEATHTLFRRYRNRNQIVR